MPVKMHGKSRRLRTRVSILAAKPATNPTLVINCETQCSLFNRESTKREPMLTETRPKQTSSHPIRISFRHNQPIWRTNANSLCQQTRSINNQKRREFIHSANDGPSLGVITTACFISKGIAQHLTGQEHKGLSEFCQAADANRPRCCRSFSHPNFQSLGVCF